MCLGNRSCSSCISVAGSCCMASREVLCLELPRVWFHQQFIDLFPHTCCVPDTGLGLGYRSNPERRCPQLKSYSPAKVCSASERIGMGWVWGPSHVLATDGFWCGLPPARQHDHLMLRPQDLPLPPSSPHLCTVPGVLQLRKLAVFPGRAFPGEPSICSVKGTFLQSGCPGNVGFGWGTLFSWSRLGPKCWLGYVRRKLLFEENH